jgi:2'-5' RNA ligase
MANFLVTALVPEVEPHIARLRERFDRAARRGLGAHVTLRHQSVPPQGLDGALIEAAAGLAAAAPSFSFAVTRVARFPSTVYLAVEPGEPFEKLHRASALLARAEPSGRVPASERRYVPHISVARRGSDVDLADPAVREAETALAGMLARKGPIRCECREIVLLEDSTGLWRPVARFALSGGTDSL